VLWSLLLLLLFLYCVYTVFNSHTLGVKATSAAASAPPPWKWRPFGRLPPWIV